MSKCYYFKGDEGGLRAGYPKIDLGPIVDPGSAVEEGHGYATGGVAVNGNW